MDVQLVVCFIVYLSTLTSVNMTPATQRKVSASDYHLRLCLANNPDAKPQIIDRRTHKCVDGVPVELSAPPTKAPVHVAQLTTNQLTVAVTSSRRKTPRDNTPARILQIRPTLTCGALQYSDPGEGSKCCGTEVYHPHNDTCCRISSNIFKVYYGKPEHNYVCCGIKKHHRRSGKIPCWHPARNDKLWRTKSIKKSSKEVCNGHTPEHEYFLLVGERVSFNGYTYFNSELIELHSQNSSNKIRHIVNVQYDKYSPNKNLQSKGFLIRSDVNYLNVNDFYLDPSDKVYKVPRNVNVFRKRFKRIKKQCNNRTQKRRKRRRHQRSRHSG